MVVQDRTTKDYVCIPRRNLYLLARDDHRSMSYRRCIVDPIGRGASFCTYSSKASIVYTVGDLDPRKLIQIINRKKRQAHARERKLAIRIQYIKRKKN